ncbi:MAG TPA: hypothetical protein VGT61_16550 [Thermomicrobiales bacterium]|jgi:SAM-dependent methyltransferase|nr:hypothetical protein [Thermomicrobiales bacterium]
MTYRYATDRIDYSAFASGHVLVSAPGRTGFPARLATELFQRAAAHLDRREVAAPWSVLDPCCGAGQLLATVGLLHADRIRALTAVDIDTDAVALADRNLALFAPGGLGRREAELRAAALDADRPGLLAAADAAAALAAAARGSGANTPLTTNTAVADATDPVTLGAAVPVGSIDLVIADVPHGNWSDWATNATGAPTDVAPLDAMLAAVRPLLSRGAVVAIASDKGQRPRDAGWRRLEWWQIGRRRLELVSAD